MVARSMPRDGSLAAASLDTGLSFRLWIAKPRQSHRPHGSRTRWFTQVRL